MIAQPKRVIDLLVGIGGFSTGSDSVQYRCLGNAVCVAVSEWLAKRIFTEMQPIAQPK